MSGKKEPQHFNHLQELAERTDKTVFVYRPDERRFTYLNPAFEQIWHKTRESVMTNPDALLDAIHPEDRDYLVQNYQALRKNGPEKTVEFRIQVFNENVQWVSVSVCLIKRGSEAPVVSGFMEEISAAKEHVETLHKYAAKKNSVLEILSHDLAGPLTTIRSVSTLLRERIKNYDDKELDTLLCMIADTNERNIRLVREFVKQEFLESANSALEFKRVDLVKVIKQVIDQYKASESDIQKVFTLKASDDLIFVELDDLKFGQVINNLISNSIKFTQDGGAIGITIKSRKESVLITVADDGIGIPDDLQQGLFEKFTRARRPGIKGEPSVGLGMSIIKTIVNWHNGKIWFESQENEGTTFYIELPLEQDS